jgi:hypothetical protein
MRVHRLAIAREVDRFAVAREFGRSAVAREFVFAMKIFLTLTYSAAGSAFAPLATI